MKPYLILAALLSLLSPIHSEPLLVQPPAATSSKLSVSDRLLARAFKQYFAAPSSRIFPTTPSAAGTSGLSSA